MTGNISKEKKGEIAIIILIILIVISLILYFLLKIQTNETKFIEEKENKKTEEINEEKQNTKKTIDSLKMENRKIEEELQKKKKQEAEKQKLTEEEQSTRKIEFDNTTWIFVSYDSNGDEYYVQDKRPHTDEGGRVFYAFCLKYFRGNGYPNDNSIIAVSPFIKFDRIRKTYMIQHDNIYYVNKPSQTRYSMYDDEKSIPKGSIIEGQYLILLKLLK